MKTGPRDLLEEAIESWEYARRSLLAEAEGIPDDAYGWRPHPNSRSVGELVYHVLQSGLMMVGELTDPEGDFTRDEPGSFIQRHAAGLPSDPAAPELRSLILSTLEEGVASFRAAGGELMLTDIRRFDGETGSRLAWMYHGIAHEEYHRGQLALYARMQGLVPALTRRIHGDAAR